MRRWETLNRKCKNPGLLMQEKDLRELYSYLQLFQRVYHACEEETGRLLQEIRDLYVLQTGSEEAEQELLEWKNPRQAGRKKKYTEVEAGAVQELRRKGMTVREIAEQTGLPKSSVQRLLQTEVSQN